MPINIKPLKWAWNTENQLAAPTFGGTMYIHRLKDYNCESSFCSAIGSRYDRLLGCAEWGMRAARMCDEEHERRIGRLLEAYTEYGRVKLLVWNDPAPETGLGVSAPTFGGRFFIRNVGEGWYRTTYYSSVNDYSKILYPFGSDKVRAYAEAERAHRERVQKFLEPYVEGL